MKLETIDWSVIRDRIAAIFQKIETTLYRIAQFNLAELFEEAKSLLNLLPELSSGSAYITYKKDYINFDPREHRLLASKYGRLMMRQRRLANK